MRKCHTGTWNCHAAVKTVKGGQAVGQQSGKQILKKLDLNGSFEVWLLMVICKEHAVV